MYVAIVLVALTVCFSSSTANLISDSSFLVSISYESIESKSYHYRCVGTLITNKHVVTAAQCVASLGNFHNVRVSIVKKDLSYDEYATPDLTNIAVDCVTVHPDYRIEALIDDIAVIHLKVPLFPESKITPIKLLAGSEYSSFSFYKGKTGIAMVWNGTQAAEISLKPISTLRCADEYEHSTSKLLKINITDAVLCASADYSVCESGIGAPIVFYHPKYSEFRLAGVASSVYKCGEYPNVFMKMAYYVDFLEKVTGAKLT